ncbi:heavy metal-binding domain-containing protein [Persephonella sp.]|nr:heavy metal-binding domain-containing protein [Aquificota bacterium]
MIITTTDTVEGKKIIEYRGIVSSQAVIGINVVRDMFARIRDFIGGRTRSYEKELEKYRNQLLQELEEKARELGANCIVGVNFSYEMYQSMLMISVWGTAVVVE